MKSREFTSFELGLVRIMTHLYEKNAVDEKVMDIISMLNIDYQTLLMQSRTLEERINVDSKTNLLKYSDDHLAPILKSASRLVSSTPSKMYDLSFVRFDIDNFSMLNTKYGHNNCDMILVDLAEILTVNSRPTDHIVRYGGEEFDVILPSTNEAGVVKYVENIYKKIRERMRYNFEGSRVNATVSAGVCIFSIPVYGLKFYNNEQIRNEYMKIQKNADHALYDAKLSGKNQYKIYSDDMDYTAIRKRYLKERRQIQS